MLPRLLRKSQKISQNCAKPKARAAEMLVIFPLHDFEGGLLFDT